MVLPLHFPGYAIQIIRGIACSHSTCGITPAVPQWCILPLQLVGYAISLLGIELLVKLDNTILVCVTKVDDFDYSPQRYMRMSIVDNFGTLP